MFIDRHLMSRPMNSVVPGRDSTLMSDQYILTFEEIRRIFLIWNEAKRETPELFDDPPPSNKIDYESRQADFFLKIHRGEFPEV